MALKILLADDSMTAQNMGKKILLDAGYEVVAVSNGAAAIKRIASDRPDIIIVDEYMPGYTGSEVCERVKNSPDTARTPVLLTVGKMEPFSPDKANKVRADGVLIKPFEATDLIAVIQSIADKISGTGTAPKASTAAAPATERISRPVEAPLNEYDDIERVDSEPAYEPTVRLTPEQVRAVQANAYTDLPPSEQTEASTPAALSVGQVVPAAAQSGIPAILEQQVASVVDTESEPALPMMPGLDASEAPIARAMASQIGQDFFTVTPARAAEVEVAPAEIPAMFGNAVGPDLEVPSQPVFTVQSPAPDAAEGLSSFADHAASLELETSAPLTPGPSSVAPLNGLEATIAPPEEVVAEVAPELEINSPIHLQPQIEVSTDPSLVTNEQDLSQFVTNFGQAGAEESHVGIVSELPPDQLSALLTPAAEPEIKQEIPQLEPPDVVYPSMVEIEEPAPVLQEAVVLTPEPEPVAEEEPHRVLEEVGTITTSALSGTAPMVAYVPGLEDTQPIPPFVASPADETQSIPAYIEPKFEVAAATTEAVFSAEPEPVVTITPEASDSHELHAQPFSAVEAAAAAAVGGGVLSGAAHFFTVSEPAQVKEEAVAESPVAPVEPPVPELPAETIVEPPVVFSPELVSHELVNEGSFSHTDVEDQAAAAADEFISSTAPEVEMALESEAGHDAHMIADSKVSEAVSRAFEKLRPQLISEIMKELFK